MLHIFVQAVWKGFILRKKLVTALEAIRNEESGEEYEEIDLEDFEYDEVSASYRQILFLRFCSRGFQS